VKAFNVKVFTLKTKPALNVFRKTSVQPIGDKTLSLPNNSGLVPKNSLVIANILLSSKYRQSIMIKLQATALAILYPPNFEEADPFYVLIQKYS